jgi:hypothetical protein
MVTRKLGFQLSVLSVPLLVQLRCPQLHLRISSIVLSLAIFPDLSRFGLETLMADKSNTGSLSERLDAVGPAILHHVGSNAMAAGELVIETALTWSKALCSYVVERGR